MHLLIQAPRNNAPVLEGVPEKGGGDLFYRGWARGRRRGGGSDAKRTCNSIFYLCAKPGAAGRLIRLGGDGRISS